MESNIVKLLNGLEYLYPEIKPVPQIKRVLKDYPECEKQLVDAYSIGQLKSKQWLVSELDKLNLNLGTVFLCAGWYATLASMLFEGKCKVNKIRSFDVDASCQPIAETINKEQVKDEWKFKASTLDIHSLQYDGFQYRTIKSDNSEALLNDTADTIINTSCEHIDNFDGWYEKIPTGKLVILQTNNFTDIADHVNCSLSLRGFELLTPMTTVLFQGQLELDKYTRFMRIGIK